MDIGFWLPRLVLLLMCFGAGVYDYFNSKHLMSKYGSEEEKSSFAKKDMFNAIAGPTVFVALLISALPTLLPLAFYTGMKVQHFYTQRAARVILG